jgi:glycogen phosphorylase
MLNKIESHEIKFEKSPVAFFSMEYGFDDEKNQYAGGLGILSADFVLEAGERNYPFIAVGLKYSGAELSSNFKEIQFDNGESILYLPIISERVAFRALIKKYSNNAYLVLLDTDIPENSSVSREILKSIYDSEVETFLKQQMILGLGGNMVLQKLYISPSIYHLNEGHTAFAALGLLLEEACTKQISLKEAFTLITGKVVATKHTILSAAGINLDKKLFDFYLGKYCLENGFSVDEVFDFEEGGNNDDNNFSTTKFLMKVAGRQNGVSKLHTVFEKKAHAESDLIPITNGINKNRWLAKEWNSESAKSEIEIKNILRKQLIEFVNKQSGQNLSPDILTMVWARRFAKYKRPDLLFSEPDRLLKILNNEKMPLQIILSGKAHPHDEFGQKTLQMIQEFIQNNNLKSKIVYLSNYNPEISHLLTAGADIWLNTPERGMEACGTSGMKAGINGTLQFSVSDGWVDEIDWEGIGWSLPDADKEITAKALFDTLENHIIPDFYNKTNWQDRINKTREIVINNYTTSRMFNDYLSKLYELN